MIKLTNNEIKLKLCQIILNLYQKKRKKKHQKNPLKSWKILLVKSEHKNTNMSGNKTNLISIYYSISAYFFIKILCKK